MKHCDHEFHFTMTTHGHVCSKCGEDFTCEIEVVKIERTFKAADGTHTTKMIEKHICKVCKHDYTF